MTGIPSQLGVSLTHRDFASSFGVFTAQTAEGNSIDWNTASKLPTTVFLMGAAKLRTIVDNLIQEGKSKDTPILIIEKGTWNEEKQIRGTLESVQSLKIQSPALIVIGQVLNCMRK